MDAWENAVEAVLQHLFDFFHYRRHRVMHPNCCGINSENRTSHGKLWLLPPAT